MTAPELSPEEQRIVARFEAAPTLPEAYQPSPPVALLDQLDELRANATAGPWRVWADTDGVSQVITDDVWVAEPQDNPADAALIVAAVNAVGPLTAAVRAVLELADEAEARNERSSFRFFDGSKRRPDVQVDAIRTALTAALSVTP